MLLYGIITVLSIALVMSLSFTVNLTNKTKEFEEKTFWYESILDALPMPLSVTDSNMNWTFINKATEDLLVREINYLLQKGGDVI